jgi:CubicO group peptidase (beta-lactamase class C family)
MRASLSFFCHGYRDYPSLSRAPFIAVSALVCCVTMGAAQTVALPDTVDRFITAEMARQRVPGFSVAVLRGDSIVLTRGYGYANVEHRVPATDSTVYEVGSVSKQFTAAAVVRLADEGRLDLEDPIVRFLPEGSAVWPRVTVRHLLTHTSGIPEDTTLDWVRDYTEAELVRSAAAQPLDFEPGDRWSYSSTGYALLGIIIHRVTGVFYGEFLRDHIFRPLGMRTATVNSNADIVPNRAAGYYFAGDTLKNQEWVSPSISTTADLGLSFSAHDLAQWAIGLNHGKGLSGAGQDMSWKPVRLNSGGTYPYGLGWYVTQQRGYRRIGHTGAWRGFQATIQRYPDFDMTVIVLANLAQAHSEGMAFGVAGLFEPALTPPHLLRGRLPGATPPTPIDRLLREIASGKESNEVTSGLKENTSTARREQIGEWVEAIQTWTFLGCDTVRDRHISRFGTRIERICYAKGAVPSWQFLFSVLYGADWRAAGFDVYFP